MQLFGITSSCVSWTKIYHVSYSTRWHFNLLGLVWILILVHFRLEGTSTILCPSILSSVRPFISTRRASKHLLIDISDVDLCVLISPVKLYFIFVPLEAVQVLAALTVPVQFLLSYIQRFISHSTTFADYFVCLYVRPYVFHIFNRGFF